MRALPILAVIGLAFTLASCDPFNSSEFGHELDTLQSVSAEGVLLSRQVEKGDTTTAFARVQAGNLADTADARVEKLHDAGVPDDLEHQVNEAISAGEAIASQLQDIAFTPGDPETARQAEIKLAALTRQIQSIKESL